MIHYNLHQVLLHTQSIPVIRGLIPNLIYKTNFLNVHLCDVRFLGCSSCLTLIKCAALRWTNRRIIDGAIRNN